MCPLNHRPPGALPPFSAFALTARGGFAALPGVSLPTVACPGLQANPPSSGLGWPSAILRSAELYRTAINSIKILATQARKRRSPARRRASVCGVTVSVTGFSVTLTGKSVAQSVADQCRFRPSARHLASIWRAEALHVIGRKTHVLRTVCNADGGVALCSDAPQISPYSSLRPSLFWGKKHARLEIIRYLCSKQNNVC